MKKIYAITVVFMVLVIMIFGCVKKGDRNNPVDPLADNYATPGPTVTPYPDPYEPDNDSTTAHEITVNDTAETHTFHESGDVDWIEITAPGPAMEWYTISTLNLATGVDTKLTMYNSGMGQVALNDDSGGPESMIVIQISAGTWYVKVEQMGVKYGTDAEYDLRVTSP